MSKKMRCPYCGLLQDEPGGVKTCARCGGGLEYESQSSTQPGYLLVQMELDQVQAPANQNLERYLLLSIHAAENIPDAERLTTHSERPSFNFNAVLDVSGSMGGVKIQQAREAIRQAVQALQDGDIFSLSTFSNEVRAILEPVHLDDKARKVVESILAEVNAGGMTALCGGLELGIAQALKDAQDTNLVLLLSDGQANIGETDLEKVGARAGQARQNKITVSSLGVGPDYNEALMAEIATQGGGRFYHIVDPSQIPATLAGELGELATLAAKDVQIRLNVPHGVTLIPVSAIYPLTQNGNEATITIGDVPCATDLEIPLRLAILAQPAGTKLSLEGEMTYRSPAGKLWQERVNRVTVRFVAQPGFNLRDGLVTPVAERVFKQMKASSVLGISRAMAAHPTEARAQADLSTQVLQEYAEKIGAKFVQKETAEIRDQMAFISAAPAVAKQVVAEAFRSVRGSKDFEKKKKE